MNASEKPRRVGIPMMSSEAMVGLGITIAEIGLLCLMLGLAEYLRSVPKIALIWLVLGAGLVIAGIVTAAVPRSRERQRTRADRVLPPGAPQDEANSREPEEQLY
jgi:hypothetical protein